MVVYSDESFSKTRKSGIEITGHPAIAEVILTYLDFFFIAPVAEGIKEHFFGDTE